MTKENFTTKESFNIDKTLRVATNFEPDWVLMNIINAMLNELQVKVEFEVTQQNTYFQKQEGAIITLKVSE